MSDLIQQAIARFDALNAEDPSIERVGERSVPKELLYAERMSARLDAFAPEASDAVRLAVRAQHIQRWKIARATYAKDRKGYLQWRQALYAHHSAIACGVLRELGADQALVSRVDRLLRKKGLKSDPEAQLVEDVACLVFLEHHFADFAPTQGEAKLAEIVRKTWAKMSDAAHEAALALPLDATSVELVRAALGV